jgi:hypothetical protein
MNVIGSADTCLEHVLSMAQPCKCQSYLVAQLFERIAADVTQCHLLKPSPDPFIRVQFGGIAWQGQQLQPLGCSLRQEPLDCVAAMSRRAIPHHQHLARDLAQDVLQKLHDPGPID